MKKYTCIIIDDEQYAIDALSTYIRSLPNLTLQKAYLDPLIALEEVSAGGGVDLMLMDIDMPLISGIDLSHQLRTRTRKLVFTTGHTHYGYQAFEAQADGYLLKPYSLSKFAATIGRLFAADVAFKPATSSGHFFFAKNRNDEYKWIKIDVESIIAVESKQNYVMIHTLKGNVLTHMSLTEASGVLKHYDGFAQFQRSFLIGIRHIDYVFGNTIRMHGGLEISVGDYYRKDFQLFLQNRLLKGRT